MSPDKPYINIKSLEIRQVTPTEYIRKIFSGNNIANSPKFNFGELVYHHKDIDDGNTYCIIGITLSNDRWLYKCSYINESLYVPTSRELLESSITKC